MPSKTQMQTRLGRELGDSLKSLGAKVLPGVGLRVAVAEACECLLYACSVDAIDIDPDYRIGAEAH